MFLFQILTLVSDKAIIDLIDNLGVSPASAALSILGSPINIRRDEMWNAMGSASLGPLHPLPPLVSSPPSPPPDPAPTTAGNTIIVS